MSQLSSEEERDDSWRAESAEGGSRPGDEVGDDGAETALCVLGSGGGSDEKMMSDECSRSLARVETSISWRLLTLSVRLRVGVPGVEDESGLGLVVMTRSSEVEEVVLEEFRRALEAS